MIEGLDDAAARDFRIKCNCLPGCTSIFYDAEIDRARFDWENQIDTYNLSSDYLKYGNDYVLSSFHELFQR